MFNFKSKEQKESNKESSNYSDVITQIHKEFNSIGDKMYEEAIEIIDALKITNEEKVIRLKKLGFTSSKEVQTAERIIQKKKISQEMVALITYYRMHYPFNKFITEEQVIAICKKYQLVYGDIIKFTGFIPEKNLQQIENF